MNFIKNIIAKFRQKSREESIRRNGGQFIFDDSALNTKTGWCWLYDPEKFAAPYIVIPSKYLPCWRRVEIYSEKDGEILDRLNFPRSERDGDLYIFRNLLFEIGSYDFKIRIHIHPT